MSDNKKSMQDKKELGLVIYCVVVIFLLFALLLLNPLISWRERMTVSVESMEKSYEELIERCESMELEIKALRGVENE